MKDLWLNSGCGVISRGPWFYRRFRIKRTGCGYTEGSEFAQNLWPYRDTCSYVEGLSLHRSGVKQRLLGHVKV